MTSTKPAIMTFVLVVTLLVASIGMAAPTRGAFALLGSPEECHLPKDKLPFPGAMCQKITKPDGTNTTAFINDGGFQSGEISPNGPANRLKWLPGNGASRDWYVLRSQEG